MMDKANKAILESIIAKEKKEYQEHGLEEEFYDTKEQLTQNEDIFDEAMNEARADEQMELIKAIKADLKAYKSKIDMGEINKRMGEKERKTGTPLFYYSTDYAIGMILGHEGILHDFQRKVYKELISPKKTFKAKRNKPSR